MRATSSGGGILRVKAPARIDLAGGTLDLWPLYLFLKRPATLNCAIDQFAEVEIATSSGDTLSAGASSMEFQSEDRGVVKRFASFGELMESFQGGSKAITLAPALWLHARVARYFLGVSRQPIGSFQLKTRCASPAGAGLGGSSALNIALCVAFRALTSSQLSPDALIALARDLETTVIDVPAGVQDYYSALFGGIQSIQFDAIGPKRRVFYKQNSFIEQHILLCYSGASRNSGINNWAVYKGFIDGDAKIRGAFDRIVEATSGVEEALSKSALSDFAREIDKEWTARQELAAGIATPEMLKAMERARDAGALATKVCGAGGGGCYFVIVPPEKRAAVAQVLTQGGSTVIDFRVVNEGCTLQGESVAHE